MKGKFHSASNRNHRETYLRVKELNFGLSFTKRGAIVIIIIIIILAKYPLLGFRLVVSFVVYLSVFPWSSDKVLGYHFALQICMC